MANPTSTSTSLAKLTSVSTLTLSLLLERQRASALPSFSSPTPSVSSSSALSSYYTPPTSTPGSTSPAPSSTGTATPSNSLHLAQIKKNLARLKEGILEIEASTKGKEKEEKGKGVLEATRLLRVQYQRMRGMLGPEVEGVDSLQEEPPSNTKMEPPPSLPLPPSSISQYPAVQSPEPSPFTPYTDDPNDGGEMDNGILLQEQRRMMNEQDAHLDVLSHSINRQHHISLQINDELDTHRGLLEELDTDVDRTQGGLHRARRGLERVSRGVKGNYSTVAIGVLIFVLLILIIVFKT